MSDHMDRPFSRLYAQLVADGEDDPDDGDGSRDPLGTPKLANPRRGSDADT
jgi:hypothetical protein